MLAAVARLQRRSLSLKYFSMSSMPTSENSQFWLRYHIRNRRIYPDHVRIVIGDRPRSSWRNEPKSFKWSANTLIGSSGRCKRPRNLSQSFATAMKRFRDLSLPDGLLKRRRPAAQSAAASSICSRSIELPTLMSMRFAIATSLPANASIV